MATVIVNTIDGFGVSKDWELEVGTNYTISCDAYGIIVIEDTLRMYSGREIGKFRSEKLSFVASGGAFDILYGDPEKREDVRAKMAFLETGTTPKGVNNVTMSVPRG